MKIPSQQHGDGNPNPRSRRGQSNDNTSDQSHVGGGRLGSGVCQVSRFESDSVPKVMSFSRYCMLFTLLLTVGLAVDPLPKLLPGYFITKLLLYIWSNNNKW